jgi:xanthine dehydrogenase small subunit
MSTVRETVRFVLDDSIVEVRDAPATTTVLEYLRNVLGRTGTKEGCAEGDCGACTVVIGELRGESIRYRAINSCIRFLGTIDGHELVTCESLASGEVLHPVQQAMVDEHASQCGFCSPGFVMSLFALYLEELQPTRETVIGALAGNLCRCTGYRSIVDAGCSMASYSKPARWSREDAQSTVRRNRLLTLQRIESLCMADFKAPRSVLELEAMLDAEPDSLLLAGGTDIALWSTKQLRDLPPLVYLGEVNELNRSEERGAEGVWIGAAVSLTDAWREIVARYPELASLAVRFASPPVCNSGTLGGNVANGSPVGDSMPILIALGVRIELRRGSTLRNLPLEQFYLGYQKKDLQPGEFVSGLTIPLRKANSLIATYKVSKRFDQDIASVCTGIAVELQDGQIAAARIAFGGMAAVPARAQSVERALIGAPYTQGTFDSACEAIDADFTPLSDMRGSSAYRLRVAKNLLQRFFLESTGDRPREMRDLRVTNG